MASFYPKYEQKNKKQTFIFRFPKFNDKVVYDPAIDLDSGATGGQATSMVTLVLVALSLAVARFLV